MMMLRATTRATSLSSRIATLSMRPFFPAAALPKLSTLRAASISNTATVPQEQQQQATTTSTPNDDLQSKVASRLAVGSHKWASMEREQYLEIIHTALANGITTLEVGQEGGDVMMSEVLSTIASEEEKESHPLPNNVELLQRVGYRTLTKNKQGWEGDVFMEELPKGAGTVQHNLSQAALKAALYDSYLLHAPSASWRTKRTLLLHNPEVQASAMDDKKLTARQEHLRTVLTDSFLYLQEAIMKHAEKPHNVIGYGVASNGFGLPDNHPLHLSWTDAVFPALQDVQATLGQVDFRVVQLPINLLETTGLQVAQQVKSDKGAFSEKKILDQTQVFAMRPLTCYPDAGTGNGKPFVLADYKLPANMDKTLQWTHTMTSPPQAYQIALKTAMAHFDASEILEAKQRGEELTTEQRETLDGCKLMQSLLHDVDQSLENVRSFAQHEEDLYNKIIPLIQDTFEGYDEETAQILQSFFGAYSLAVRYAIAKNTRQVLVEGEKASDGSSKSKSSAPKYPDLSPDVRLQEYAIDFLLKADKSVDKLLIGFSEAEQILEDMDIIHQHYSKQK